MGISNIVLQYLKVLLSWPVITLVLVMSFIKLFKDPISDFIRRLIKGEIGSVKLQAISPADQKKEAEEFPPIQPENELEFYVKNNPREAIKTIIEISRNFRFEKIFNIIYGTQINLLTHLSTKGDSGDKYINLAFYYHDYISRSKFYSAKIEDYFGFLEAMQMIEFFGEGNDVSIRITPEGINFLFYIIKEYPPTFNYKPF